MQKTLFLIADYGTNDPSFAEVLIRLRALIPNVFIHPLSTPPFSTLFTGFWTYQLALTPDIRNTFIFSNTAPRLENVNPQKENDGEKLMYAKLSNGFEILGVNAGFAFSFVKPHVTEFYYAETETNGSQFRSRDYFPECVAKMITGDRSFMGEKANPAIISDFPSDRIVSIDGYGNMKTTLRNSQVSFAVGEQVIISINGVTHTALYSNGIFNVHNGELVVAPGSSGYEDRFLEIAVRGSNAARLFKDPVVESPFSFQKKE